MGTISADGGWFGPGDDLERAWDEAEAVLLAAEDLDGVMEVIREAESPVEARRALKLGFGFTGRQAALLLTLPVMSFTRSERRRIDAGRRARMELLADVTGVLPAVRPAEPEAPSPAWPDPVPDDLPSPDALPAPTSDWSSDFGAAFDGVLAGISSAMEESDVRAPSLLTVPSAPEPEVEAEPEPSRPPVRPSDPACEDSSRRTRRSLTVRDDASAVLDEQIGELCDAIAMMVGVRPPTGVWSDDPRSSSDESGALLDSCGVDDRAGLRTLLWHLRRTGLDSVEGLLPFSEPLTVSQGFDAQAVRFDMAMSEGGLGSRPGGDVRWASRLWPIAERRGFGYAVVYGGGPDDGSVWAYGGDEPLHRLWDSVVDVLVELYQSLATGSPCDAAVGTVLDGRVVWANLN